MAKKQKRINWWFALGDVAVLALAVALNAYVYYSNGADTRDSAMEAIGEINFAFLAVIALMTLLTFTYYQDNQAYIK